MPAAEGVEGVRVADRLDGGGVDVPVLVGLGAADSFGEVRPGDEAGDSPAHPATRPRPITPVNARAVTVRRWRRATERAVIDRT
jgi:hypothetical protein